ncbi:hypothetical protein SGPA1_41067 [Streptomyces misionensis JCM 4497]
MHVLGVGEGLLVDGDTDVFLDLAGSGSRRSDLFSHEGEGEGNIVNGHLRLDSHTVAVRLLGRAHRLVGFGHGLLQALQKVTHRQLTHNTPWLAKPRTVPSSAMNSLPSAIASHPNAGVGEERGQAWQTKTLMRDAGSGYCLRPGTALEQGRFSAAPGCPQTNP